MTNEKTPRDLLEMLRAENINEYGVVVCRGTNGDFEIKLSNQRAQDAVLAAAGADTNGRLHVLVSAIAFVLWMTVRRPEASVTDAGPLLAGYNARQEGRDVFVVPIKNIDVLKRLQEMASMAGVEEREIVARIVRTALTMMDMRTAAQGGGRNATTH